MTFRTLDRVESTPVAVLFWMTWSSKYANLGRIGLLFDPKSVYYCWKLSKWMQNSQNLKIKRKKFQFRCQTSKTLHYGAGAYPEWRYQSESNSFSLFFLPVWATLMEVSCFVSLIELFWTFWPHFGFDFLFLGDFWAVLNNAHPYNARSKVEYS